MITNQAGIGRGFIDQTTLEGIHPGMKGLLAIVGVCLTGIYFSSHFREESCRPPELKPGLLEKTAYFIHCLLGQGEAKEAENL